MDKFERGDIKYSSKKSNKVVAVHKQYDIVQDDEGDYLIKKSGQLATKEKFSSIQSAREFIDDTLGG